MDPLSGVDLPLLVALRHLLETRSVTITARRLGTTQPSMSRTLARLRALFGDPLFTSVGRTLAPTTLARDLEPRVETALASLRALFGRPVANAPEREQRIVRIAALDYAASELVEPWFVKLQRTTPNIGLRIEPVTPDSVEPLARGELDFAVAPRLPLEGLDQLVFREVLRDRYVCVVRADHPRASKRLTLAEYVRLEHVMVGNAVANYSTVQLALQERGRHRRVVASVPSFLSALQLVANSDFAAALPARFVRHSPYAVRARALPLPLPPLVLHLVWHPRRTTDPWHRWIRGTLLGAS